MGYGLGEGRILIASNGSWKIEKYEAHKVRQGCEIMMSQGCEVGGSYVNGWKWADKVGWDLECHSAGLDFDLKAIGHTADLEKRK